MAWTRRRRWAGGRERRGRTTDDRRGKAAAVTRPRPAAARRRPPLASILGFLPVASTSLGLLQPLPRSHSQSVASLPGSLALVAGQASSLDSYRDRAARIDAISPLPAQVYSTSNQRTTTPARPRRPALVHRLLPPRVSVLQCPLSARPMASTIGWPADRCTCSRD